MILHNDGESMDKINGLLYQLGATPNYIGFFHTAYAVFLSLKAPECLTMATKLLYPDVAKHYCTSWKAVERNIRTLITHIWTVNPDSLIELAQYPMEGKPTPTQFISILVAYFSSEAAA